MSAADHTYSIEYQGHACREAVSYTRSVGLEPEQGFVVTTRRVLADPAVKEWISRFADDLEFVADLARGAPDAPSAGLLPAGKLVLKSGAGDEAAVARQVVAIAHAYLLPDALDTVTEDHGERRNDELRLALSDPRMLFAGRGALYFACNVLRQSGAQSGLDSGAQRAAPGAPVRLPAERFERGSLRGKGDPWTLEQVLRERVLPALPGAPALRRLPPGYEVRQPLNHIWEGHAAVEALRELLTEFSLLAVLDADSSLSLWLEGEGDLALEDGTPLEGLAHVQRDERTTRWPYRPAVVEVIGHPIIQTARVEDWEPVGRRRDGAIVPLEEAARDWGVLSLESLGTLLAVQEADQAALAAAGVVSAEALEAVNEWALRWFRLPGSSGERAHMWPILDRAEVDAAGVRLPPLVESQRVLSTSIMEMASTNPVVAAGYAQRARTESLQPMVSYTSPLGAIEDWMAVGDLIEFRRQVGQMPGTADRRQFLELTRLEAPPVHVTYGYEAKMAGGQPASRKNRYVSRWRLEGSEAVQTVSEAVAARIVYADLRELRTLSGASNRALLDQKAAEIAKGILTRPDVEEGRVLTVAGWWPVQLNGRVRSVTWTIASGSGGVAPVTILAVDSSLPTSLGATTGNLQAKHPAPRMADTALRDVGFA